MELKCCNSWKRSRYGFTGFVFVSMMFCWFVLRLALVAAFRPAGSAAETSSAFLSGFRRDFFAGVLFLLPLLFWFLITPERLFRSRGHRIFFWAVGLVFSCFQVFLLFA